MSVSIDDASASSVIREYLSARNKWELDAWKLSRVDGDESLVDEAEAQIQAGYDAVLRQYCAPRVIALDLRAHYRHPPSVDPNRTRIVSSKGVRGAMRVVTAEDDLAFGNLTYEYDLVELDGALKISERRFRPATGRPIRDVW